MTLSPRIGDKPVVSRSITTLRSFISLPSTIEQFNAWQYNPGLRQNKSQCTYPYHRKNRGGYTVPPLRVCCQLSGRVDSVLLDMVVHHHSAMNRPMDPSLAPFGEKPRFDNRLRSEEHTSELLSLAYLVCR